ncbi:MAG: TonB-dependent receptor [Bacteroidales bacterium]
MKRFLIIFSFWVYSISSSFGQEKLFIPFDYTGLSFEEFVKKAESEMGLRFFYKQDWVAGLKMPGRLSCTEISCVLDSLFHKTNVRYVIEKDRVVITGKYEIVLLDAASRKPVNSAPITMLINESREKENEEIKTMTIGNAAEKNKQGNVVMTGFVINKDTREPIEGANVYIPSTGSGATTNRNGFYSLTLPRGTYQLQLSFIGMFEKKLNLNLFGNGQLSIEMDSKLIPLREIVVSSRRSTSIEKMETGVEKFNISSVKLLPTSLGEADLIKNLNHLAGVQSAGEGSSGYNVRGGSEDQNLILLHGAPLYNPSHFFGFFTSINSDAIKDATLYKGGIPARYGGRISSVLDIESKDGNYEEIKGNAGISPIAAHLTVEGPLIKDTLSFNLSLRTTYSDWLIDIIDVESLKNTRISFMDFNGRVSYRVNDKNKLDISGYYSSDYFVSNFNTSYKYSNNITSLNWNHIIRKGKIFNLSINNSNYMYSNADSVDPIAAYILRHRINSSSISAEVNLANGRNDINYGIGTVFYSVIPGDISAPVEYSRIQPRSLAKERASELALWISDKFKLTDFLSINAGIRLSAFSSFGPRDVLTYDEGFSKTSLTVNDTINYSKGELTSFYFSPEFRFSMNFRLSENNSLKLSYNRTSQNIHLLSNSYSISPTATWKLSDHYLSPEKGDQYSIGIYHVFKKSGAEIFAESYYKIVNDMFDYKGGSSILMEDHLEQFLVPTMGKAYGIEAGFRKTEGRFLFSAAYTYSRSLSRSTGKYRDELINSGKWYPSNFDKPENLSVTLQYLYSRRFSFSTEYTHFTGRPITYPVATYYLNGVQMIQYSERNKYRLPDYSRLDVSARFSGNLKSHKIAHPSLTISVYNVLSNENAFSVYFVGNGWRVNGYKMSIFGRAFPTMTFSFDF